MGGVELVGVRDVAALLGVSRARADQLSRADGFPTPVATLAGGRQRVWGAGDIRRWAKSRGRTTPPPAA